MNENAATMRKLVKRKYKDGSLSFLILKIGILNIESVSITFSCWENNVVLNNFPSGYRDIYKKRSISSGI